MELFYPQDVTLSGFYEDNAVFYNNAILSGLKNNTIPSGLKNNAEGMALL